MKMIRKIAMLLLAVCLIAPTWAMVSRAASGEVQVTDHTGTDSVEVGTSFEVTCAVKTDAGMIGDVEVSISYDNTVLQYEGVRCENGNGTLTEAAANQLVFDGSGDGANSALRFYMTFYVLKTGTTTVTVESCKASLASGDALTCVRGKGTIATVAGEAGSEVPPKQTETTVSASDLAVVVNDVEYTLASNIPAEEIPKDFVEIKKELDGAERTFVTNELWSMTLGYLVNAEGTGAFFIYNEESAEFAPFTMVQVSTSTSIVWLSDLHEVELPSGYHLTELTIEGKNVTYPVWQKEGDANNYLLYAMNNRGEKGLYQYDVQEGTYQRFSVVQEAPQVEAEDESLSGLEKFVVNHFERAIFIAAIVIGFLLLVVIIVGIKLHNRNRELDELYDEYEIDLDEELPKTPVKTRREERKDEGIAFDDFQYEDEESYEDPSYENEIGEEEDDFIPKKTMKEESTFEDFDLDFIDLDD